MTQYKLDILFLCDGLPFDGETIRKSSLGGSETACIQLAEALAARGHRCNVFSRCGEIKTVNKVIYYPIENWDAFTKQSIFDVAIIQRWPKFLIPSYQTRINILWCHDMVTAEMMPDFRGVAWNMDRLVVVSEFMKKHYQEMLLLPDELFFIGRNGIDLSLFEKPNTKRDKKKLVYAARFERGIDNVIRIFKKILERDPTYTLYIAGYSDLNISDPMKVFYQNSYRQLHELGDSVVIRQGLSKRDLYSLYSSAGAYIYPTPSAIYGGFREVSCITAMECMAAGLPFISTKNGALPETVPDHCGILIDIDPIKEREEYDETFIHHVLSVTTNDGYFDGLSQNALSYAKSLQWGDIAEQWEKMFFDIFKANTKNIDTLVNHFVRHSDIMAADYVLQKNGQTSTELETLYGFRHSEQALIDHYSKSVKEKERNVFDETIKKSYRYQALKGFVQEYQEHISSILDYGCHDGEFSIHLSNELDKDIFVYGYDFSEPNIDVANNHKTNYAKKPKSIFFSHKKPPYGKTFDLVVLQEIIEHHPEPWKLIDDAERFATVGSIIYVTVPYGPWEYQIYDSGYPRQHLWEFDHHDLMDLFGKKKALRIDVLPTDGVSKKMNTPLGWYVIKYVYDPDCPTGKIDMDRKALIQRPRQTVSLNMIAGPESEQTLDWCLNSVKYIADEIVIVDCGMSDEACEIAEKHGADIVAGVDPKQEGFETARNIGLEYCSSDWILWLDTDEKLVDPQKLHKYLRHNIFQGYSIQQHHFACDTTFPPDLPVRLFRNNGKLQWYGMIHEHPETELNGGPGETIVLGDVHIAHLGYLIETVRKERFVRNYPLLQRDVEKYPDRNLNKHFIMRDNMILCSDLIRMSNGQLTDEIVERCYQTIDLWRKHFRGNRLRANTDTIDYYSQACAFLGIGFEVDFSFSVSRLNANPEPHRKIRFANIEDMEIEMSARLRYQSEIFSKSSESD